MDAAFCTDCKRNTEVVLDHASGDTVCSECGLVLESHYIDETSEWRTFADDTGDTDPMRVGGASNPLLDDGHLSTMIAKPNGTKGDFLNTSLQRWNGADPERNRNAALIQAFKSLDEMGSKIALVGTIMDSAKELYKKADEDNSYKIKNREAMLAACIYLACKHADKPRTLKEIKTVTNGTTVKEIGRASKLIQDKLPKTEAVTKHATSLMMSRFGSNLGLPYLARKAAEETVKKLEEFDVRRAPTSIAAAVIYMITELSEEKKTVQEIANVTGVAINTIRESYKEITPYISRIVPTWFTEKMKA